MECTRLQSKCITCIAYRLQSTIHTRLHIYKVQLHVYININLYIIKYCTIYTKLYSIHRIWNYIYIFFLNIIFMLKRYIQLTRFLICDIFVNNCIPFPIHDKIQNKVIIEYKNIS